MLLLPVSLAPVAAFCGDDSSRYSMSGVQVEQLDGGAARVEATDAVRAVQVVTKPAVSTDYPDVPGAPDMHGPEAVKGIVPGYYWKSVFAEARKLTRKCTTPVLRSVAVAVAVCGGEVRTVTYNPAAGAVPSPATQLLAGKPLPVPDSIKRYTAGEPLATFSVDAAGLADALAALAKLANPDDMHPRVRFEIRRRGDGPAVTQAIVLRVENPAEGLDTVTALVMPLTG
jgi:hypothetical protein